MKDTDEVSSNDVEAVRELSAQLVCVGQHGRHAAHEHAEEDARAEQLRHDRVQLLALVDGVDVAVTETRLQRVHVLNTCTYIQ